MNNWTADEVLDRLKPLAVKACANAYTPYSQFPVGAALVTNDGRLYSGCNVENASFGLTMCAERNAIGTAVGDGVGRRQMPAMLIYTPGDVVHAPCGACRQVMHEFLDDDAVVISCCDSGETQTWSMRKLIPDPFDL